MRKPVNTFQNLEKSHLGIADIFKKSKQLFFCVFKDLDNFWKEKQEKVLWILGKYKFFFHDISVNFLCSMNDQQAELSDSYNIY